MRGERDERIAEHGPANAGRGSRVNCDQEARASQQQQPLAQEDQRKGPRRRAGHARNAIELFGGKQPVELLIRLSLGELPGIHRDQERGPKARVPLVAVLARAIGLRQHVAAREQPRFAREPAGDLVLRPVDLEAVLMSGLRAGKNFVPLHPRQLAPRQAAFANPRVGQRHLNQLFRKLEPQAATRVASASRRHAEHGGDSHHGKRQHPRLGCRKGNRLVEPLRGRAGRDDHAGRNWREFARAFRSIGPDRKADADSGNDQPGDCFHSVGPARGRKNAAQPGISRREISRPRSEVSTNHTRGARHTPPGAGDRAGPRRGASWPRPPAVAPAGRTATRPVRRRVRRQ